MSQGPAAAGRTFQIHACLGRGGFGEVYRATMTSSGGVQTEVAVKILREDIDPGSEAVKRLRDEGRLLGALRHPAILKVHDLVMLEGRVGLVTEFVEGQDLDQCIAAEPTIPPRALLSVVGEVAAALDAAWSSPSTAGQPIRLVHRDIKPANIRIGRHGEVKLLDFGIARAANVAREAHTASNSMMGSYLYMAPERFHTEDVEPPSDVYALGCVLFEGLVGRRFFEGQTLKQIYGTMLAQGKFETHREERLALLDGSTPNAILGLLRDLLHVDPDFRPDATETASRCEDMVEYISGPTLKRWARKRVWPPHQPVSGSLDGRQLTASTFVSQANLRPTEHRALPPVKEVMPLPSPGMEAPPLPALDPSPQPLAEDLPTATLAAPGAKPPQRPLVPAPDVSGVSTVVPPPSRTPGPVPSLPSMEPPTPPAPVSVAGEPTQPRQSAAGMPLWKGASTVRPIAATGPISVPPAPVTMKPPASSTVPLSQQKTIPPTEPVDEDELDDMAFPGASAYFEIRDGDTPPPIPGVLGTPIHKPRGVAPDSFDDQLYYERRRQRRFWLRFVVMILGVLAVAGLAAGAMLVEDPDALAAEAQRTVEELRSRWEQPTVEAAPPLAEEPLPEAPSGVAEAPSEPAPAQPIDQIEPEEGSAEDELSEPALAPPVPAAPAPEVAPKPVIRPRPRSLAIQRADLRRQGWTAVERANHNEAVALFDRALELSSSDADAWYGRGYALMRMGRGAEATESLCWAIQHGDSRLRAEVRSVMQSNELACPTRQ